jgi:hypothetical protein
MIDSMAGLRVKTHWIAEVIDKEGNVVSRDIVDNTMMTEGLNHYLNAVFRGATTLPNWYIIPFSSNTTPSASDTYASRTFTEYSGFSESTRRSFTSDAASTDGSLTNESNLASFSITETVTIYGGALVAGSSTKGDTTVSGGILMAAAKFTSAQVLAAGNTLRVHVAVTAVDG